MICRNGSIADFSLVLSGCTRGNAVPLTLGAGQGSKSASLYQIKYMSKNSVDISQSASVLIEAYDHNVKYPSVAEDATTYDRIAKYFCQRVINHSAMELEGGQAAEIVLGERSSGSSDALVFFSGWDMQRLARIAAAGHASDVNFSNEEAHEEDDNADNEPAELPPAIPTEATTISTNSDTIDLLSKLSHLHDKELDGYAQVYRTSQNENVPVSTAHHYMHRDLNLWRFSAYEFVRIFTVRAMTTNDRKWYEKEIAPCPPNFETPPTKGGRTCERFRLMPPHPLHDSHILVPREKLGIPAFAGTPPPTDTSFIGPAAVQKRKRYAEFFVSNFIPWSATQPPILSYDTWINHVNMVEDEACLRHKREPDIATATTLDEKLAIESAKRSRMIAAGRLFDIDNCTGCFKTREQATVLLGKARARTRTLWKPDGLNKPSCGLSSDTLRAASAIQKLRDKADRVRSTKDQPTRQKDALWASTWTEELRTAMHNSQGQSTVRDGSQQQLRLQATWGKAAFPTKKCLTGGILDPRHLVGLLMQPIVLNDGNEWDSSGPTVTQPRLPEGIEDNDPFAEITDLEYENAAALHKFMNLTDIHAPLNPEQRASGRQILKVTSAF